MNHAIAKHEYFAGKLSTIAGCFTSALDCVFVRVTRACVICVGVIFAGPAAAADEVTRAEAWFNKIKSIEADFVQVASDGTSSRRSDSSNTSAACGGAQRSLRWPWLRLMLHLIDL